MINLANKLRSHQASAVNFLLAHNNRAILADSAGLGKSLSILTAVNNFKYYPVLIVVNKPGLSVWSNELIKWFNEPSAIITGTPKQRSERLQAFITTKGCNYLITNYAFFEEILIKLTPIYFKTLILDEYHLPGLLNRKTKIYKLMKSVRKIIPHIILSTGTPMRKNPSDYFAPLSVIAPNVFTSYWRFVSDWCIKIEGDYGYTIEGIPQNEDKFRRMLDKYRRRYTDKSHLPPRTRQPIPIEMTSKQAKLYNQLHEEMVLAEDGSFIITPNKMTNILRCRQLLVCPTILGFNELGRAMEIAKELVIEELSEGNPVVVFVPFVPAIDIFKEQLNDLKLDIYTIHGGMKLEEYQSIQQGFQSNPSKDKVLISTIQSGTTATYTESSVAIFIGYDFGLHTNLQAEDRLWRETQENHVRIYYILYKDSVDDRAIEILNNKTRALAVDVTVEDYYRGLIDKPNKL